MAWLHCLSYFPPRREQGELLVSLMSARLFGRFHGGRSPGNP